MTEDVDHYVAPRPGGRRSDHRAGGRFGPGLDSDRAAHREARDRDRPLPRDARHRPRARSGVRRRAGARTRPTCSDLDYEAAKRSRDLPVSSAPPSTDLGRSTARVRAGRTRAPAGRALRLERVRLRPSLRGRRQTVTWDDEPLRHLIEFAPGDNRVDITLDGRPGTLALVGCTLGGEGLLDVAGLETEALYGWFDRTAVRRLESRVRLRWPARPAAVTLYDRDRGIYDPWSRSVTEDVEFYVDEALAIRRPRGRARGRNGPHRGSDRPGRHRRDRRRPLPGMLAVARAARRARGVSSLVDLRLGDLREPPVTERVPLVICPFRSLLHMATEDEKLRALRAARRLLEPGGRLVFDVFAPSREDIDETRRPLARARARHLRARRLGRGARGR